MTHIPKKNKRGYSREWRHLLSTKRISLKQIQTSKRSSNINPSFRGFRFSHCGLLLSWKDLASIVKNVACRLLIHSCKTFNLLTPNDLYMGRTAPLTSKRWILYIYSTNIGTEYFKHALYSPFFSLQNAVCFVMLTCLVPVIFAFYTQGVLKLFRRQKVNTVYLRPVNRKMYWLHYVVRNLR